jgi:hypothetical protein
MNTEKTFGEMTWHDLEYEIMQNKDSLQNLVAALCKALQRLLQAEEKEYTAKLQLKAAQDRVLLDHFDDIKLLGSNEQLRDAKIRSMTSSEEAYSQECRRMTMDAQSAVEILRVSIRGLEKRGEHLRMGLDSYIALNETEKA